MEAKRITITVDHEVWEIIERGAAESHRSASGQIRHLIAAGIAADKSVSSIMRPPKAQEEGES